MNGDTIVLSLCDKTGNAVDPWADAGYECWIVDIQHPSGVGRLLGNIRKIGADVTRFCPPLNRDIAFIYAFPPCTDLAVSGASHFASKGLDRLCDAIEVVSACRRICEAGNCPYLIENPVSTLSTYWRKPNYKFDPCEYAGYLDHPELEAYTKKTCLWTGGGFRMPLSKPVRPTLGSRTLTFSPGEDRANLRSETPKGFSKAVFLANQPYCKAVTIESLTEDEEE